MADIHDSTERASMEYRDRPGPEEYADFYAGYIARVPEGDIVAILRDQIRETRERLLRAPPERADYSYAPGKWSVKEVVGHLADVERVFGYRALRFARGDRTELAGFDENAYVAAAGFGARSLEHLVDDLAAVRLSTVALLAGLDPAAWTRRGLANGSEVSVRAVACIIAGHELHHRALLDERYNVA